MRRKEMSHGEMIGKVWPDKALFGAVMLFLTSVVTVAFAIFSNLVEVSFSDKVPRFLADYPSWLSILLSVATFLLAVASLRERNTMFALWGCATGVASLGLLGVGSILSVVALAFLLLSRLEREDYTPATLRLTTDQWPDKSLAASLLCLMMGVVCLAWGAALSLELLTWELGQSQLFGSAAVLAGLVCLFGAVTLYYQRGLWIGALASLGGFASLAFWIVGPMLSLACLVLLMLAHREREFDRQAHAVPEAAGKPAR